MNNEDYLCHYGVMGMKWGVRRYQNYDGSYTKKGLQRFNESQKKYESASNRYKNAKLNYKSSKHTSSASDSKVELTNSRMAKKRAKNELERNYRRLKNDNLADKGKELYSKGKTIRGNKRATNFVATAGVISLVAARNASLSLGYNTKTANWMRATGIGLISAANIKRIYDNNSNQKLRAYYGHSRYEQRYK